HNFDLNFCDLDLKLIKKKLFNALSISLTRQNKFDKSKFDKSKFDKSKFDNENSKRLISTTFY
ncbi:hypothetical protein BpHYR1_031086, partial [Brachionus plicatilis]